MTSYIKFLLGVQDCSTCGPDRVRLYEFHYPEGTRFRVHCEACGAETASNIYDRGAIDEWNAAAVAAIRARTEAEEQAAMHAEDAERIEGIVDDLLSGADASLAGRW